MDDLERTRPQSQRNARSYKRSININGYPTSVSPEDPFWNALNEIAATRNVRLSELVAMIDRDRQHANLTSVLRLFILDHYRSIAARRADQPNAS
jgi:predicted DNA-binding ribbon-helix-helix protein